MTVEVSSPGPAAVPAVGRALAAPTVDEQLARLEARLVAEAGGDPAAEARVLCELVLVRATFESATVRRFLPILVERAVRRRLAAGPADVLRPAADPGDGR